MFYGASPIAEETLRLSSAALADRSALVKTVLALIDQTGVERLRLDAVQQDREDRQALRVVVVAGPSWTSAVSSGLRLVVS